MRSLGVTAAQFLYGGFEKPVVSGKGNIAVVELLARPQLTDLPENPVGRVRELLRSVYPDFVDTALPEVIELPEAEHSIAREAMYIEPNELHRVGHRRILRYDLTLPLLLTFIATLVVYCARS